MEGRRVALLIASSNYTDPELSKLMAPADDAAELARVLARQDICGFEVQTFHDQPAYKLSREIEKFFLRDRQHDDLLLLYFSGHGIRDLDGQLYFAAADTELYRHQILQATAISARFVNEVMTRSRSRRQVLLLDCCHSGAFKEGMLAKGDVTAGVIEQLQGQGRVVLTASNALQYSFEGDVVHGSGKRSLFTHALVEGIETGDADYDCDGRFSIDDIYSYVCERIRGQQQPTKIEMVEGTLFLGENPRPKAAKLPDDLFQDLAHDRREIRLNAVNRLLVLLQGSHKGKALAAQLELIRLRDEDDSYTVRETAKRYLEQCQAEVEPQTAAEAQQRVAREKAAAAEQERIAREKAEAERREREQAEAAERERKARAEAEAERQEREKAAAAERERIAREKAGWRAVRSWLNRTTEDLVSVAVSDDGRSAWAVGYNGVILHTTDGGNTWRQQSSGTKVDLYGVAVSDDGRFAWAVGSGGVILHTTDGGNAWRQQSSGMTRVRLHGVAVSEQGRSAWAVGGDGTILRFQGVSDSS
jgi:Caspase domain/Photosynthesis system II assembly factor YCF48